MLTVVQQAEQAVRLGAYVAVENTHSGGTLAEGRAKAVHVVGERYCLLTVDEQVLCLAEGRHRLVHVNQYDAVDGNYVATY